MRIDRLLLACFILIILVLPSYQSINEVKYKSKNIIPSPTDDDVISYYQNPHKMSYTSHSPIFITGNDDFTSENGVVAGNGTKNNPYIIEGWEIKGNLFWKMVNRALYYLERSKLDARLVFFVNIPVCGIYLMDTTKHVTIRDNYIHDWSGGREMLLMAGITIINASNVTIEHNLFENNGIGIDIANCNWIQEIHENYTTTYLKYYNCTNINIKFNNFVASQLRIRYTYNSSITYNNISKSSFGIVCNSSRVYIAYNNIFSNSNGIFASSGNIIESNIIADNGNGIYCGGPVISNNTISHNGVGIFISPGHPTISNNTITNNECGILRMEVNKQPMIIMDNIISNNSFGGIDGGYGPAVIKHNIISYSGGGVTISGNVTLEYNIISSNQEGGVACGPDEIIGKIYTPSIHYNTISHNGKWGMVYTKTVWNVTINATYNYWGAADGPSDYGNGSGDSVDKNIIFEPWLAEPDPNAGPR